MRCDVVIPELAVMCTCAGNGASRTQRMAEMVTTAQIYSFRDPKLMVEMVRTSERVEHRSFIRSEREKCHPLRA